MPTIKWSTPGSSENVLTTELNSLANAANKLSAALSNDTELDLFADFELFVNTQGSARSAGAFVALYLLETTDGTNYTFGADATDPPSTAWVGNFALDAATTARYVHLRGVQLPPFDFKVLVKNATGQTFAASGNTLKMRRYNLASS